MSDENWLEYLKFINKRAKAVFETLQVSWEFAVEFTMWQYGFTGWLSRPK